MLFLALAIFTFVSFLNAKFMFTSAEKAKTMFRESNIYPLIASGIRNNLSKQGDIPIDQGAFMEFTNEAISEEAIKIFSEDFIDQFFKIVNTPGSPLKITLHFSALRENVAGIMAKNKVATTPEINNFLADRDVDLSHNPFVVILANINKILIGSAIAAVLFIGLLLISGNWSQKLIWLGVTFLLSFITFLFETLFYYLGMTESTVARIAKLSDLQDDKFILAAKKLVETVAEFQRPYFLIVTIISLVLGVGLIVVGRVIASAPAGVPSVPEGKPSSAPVPTAPPPPPSVKTTSKTENK